MRSDGKQSEMAVFAEDWLKTVSLLDIGQTEKTMN